MLTAWRLVHKRKVDEAFTGTGSRHYGGRWNYKGIGVVYVSDSLALAALEIIVHAVSYQALRDYSKLMGSYLSQFWLPLPQGYFKTNQL